MKDKNETKLKIGNYVRCNGPYTFDPSEGILINRYFVKLYKCSNKSDKNWNRKNGWYYVNEQIEKMSKEEYLLSKLKE